MHPIQFWFEFASTYSYPAAMAIGRACEARGLTLEYKPMLLGPIFQAQGLTDSPFNLQPSKGVYMWRDLERICAAERLPFQRPSAFPRGSLVAARVVSDNTDAPWIGDFIRRVYVANFGEDRDIADPAVVGDLLASLSLDADTILQGAASDTNKRRLREWTEQAQSKGIFGAPSFVVDGELFWGQDRLSMALAYAQADGALEGFAPVMNGAFEERFGPGGRDAVHSLKKVCFVASDQVFLARLLARLAARSDCYYVKYSRAPRDGMYLGRCFMTTDEAARQLCAGYKLHPLLMTTIQDDHFFRPDPA